MIKNICIAVFTAVLLAGNSIAAKFTLAELEPLTASFLRYIVALVFLTILLLIKKQNLFKVQRSDILKFVAIGIFGFTCPVYFFFTSLNYTSVINTGIISATSPVLTALMATIFLKERLSIKNYFGVFISFIGILILLSKGDLGVLIKLNFQYGDMLMYVAVLSLVVYSLMIKGLSENYNSFTITYVGTFIGTIPLLFLSFTEDSFGRISQISTTSWLALLYMGVFAAGISYLLFNYTIVKMGPIKSSGIIYSSIPIFVTILSILFFNEEITDQLIISLILVIVGLNFLMLKPSRTNKI